MNPSPTPTPSGARRIEPCSVIPFPCWLWHVALPDGRGHSISAQWVRWEHEPVVVLPYKTHWHPDQPEAPTFDPTASPIRRIADEAPVWPCELFHDLQNCWDVFQNDRGHTTKYLLEWGYTLWRPLPTAPEGTPATLGGSEQGEARFDIPPAKDPRFAAIKAAVDEHSDRSCPQIRNPIVLSLAILDALTALDRATPSAPSSKTGEELHCMAIDFKIIAANFRKAQQEIEAGGPPGRRTWLDAPINIAEGYAKQFEKHL
jgi:hypothetical protein